MWMGKGNCGSKSRAICGRETLLWGKLRQSVMGREGKCLFVKSEVRWSRENVHGEVKWGNHLQTYGGNYRDQT